MSETLKLWPILILLCYACAPRSVVTSVESKRSPILMESPGVDSVSSSDSAMAVIPAPTPNALLISWAFPVSSQTPDLKFQVRTNDNLNARLPWMVGTNVPGSNRSAVFAAKYPRQFFYVTASNYVGVSAPSTK